MPGCSRLRARAPWPRGPCRRATAPTAASPTIGTSACRPKCSSTAGDRDSQSTPATTKTIWARERPIWVRSRLATAAATASLASLARAGRAGRARRAGKATMCRGSRSAWAGSGSSTPRVCPYRGAVSETWRRRTGSGTRWSSAEWVVRRRPSPPWSFRYAWARRVLPMEMPTRRRRRAPSPWSLTSSMGRPSSSMATRSWRSPKA
mmetsp:Transcript_80836/g.234428  ORF Transcript_80836/g.234428 Transcript_80836/m.234428 type:complete len:206 (+) Transcript_80836:110-727(+)